MSGVKALIILGMAAIVFGAMATGRPVGEVVTYALMLAAMLVGSAVLGRAPR